MPGIKELSNQMRQLEDQLVTCMKCGMCQSVCPLFDQTHKEADVARGKLVLLESLIKNMFDNPHGVNQRLNKCLLCGSCAANCPSGVNAVEIFITARAIITGYLKLSLAKRLVFRKMLVHPKLFDRIVRMGGKLQNFFLTSTDPATRTAGIKMISPLLKRKRIIPVADHFFASFIDKLLANADIANADPDGLPVAFFTGCLIDKMFPNIGIATVKTLLHHNCWPIIPKNQGCCGIPALAAGDTDTFLTLVKYNLELFEAGRYEYLVTACATCTATIRKLWPAMVRDQGKTMVDGVTAMSHKTLDISQFLCDIIKLKPQDNKNGDPGNIVTYHDPCHLAKSLGVLQQPRNVIEASRDCTFKEMAEPDRCCGMGGSFNLYHYDISSNIGNIKKDQIEATGCHTVATSCPACMMQISDLLSRAQANIYVRHPIELYAKGIK